MTPFALCGLWLAALVLTVLTYALLVAAVLWLLGVDLAVAQAFVTELLERGSA